MARRKKKSYTEMDILDIMSLPDLQRYRKSLAKKMNARIRTFEKHGLGDQIRYQYDYLNDRLTKSGKFSEAKKPKLSEQQLKDEILELRSLLEKKSSTYSGYRKSIVERANKLKDYGVITAGDVESFSEFMSTRAYAELEEEYSSYLLMEQYNRIGNDSYTVDEISKAFELWKSERGNRNVDEILKGMKQVDTGSSPNKRRRN